MAHCVGCQPKSDHLVRMFSQDESLTFLVCTIDILKASAAGDNSS